jgi:anti-sigma factor RsiW
MNCQTCQSQLSAYLDAELTGEQMINVRRHLQECPTCAEEAESVKTTQAYQSQADRGFRSCCSFFTRRRRCGHSFLPYEHVCR